MSKDNILVMVNSGNQKLDAKIKEWLEWDKNESTHKEVELLVENGDYVGLDKILMKRLEFGTAGLRAALGAGYTKMNDLTVIQTTQGFCEYLKVQFSDIKTMGVVIGHDARHGSHRFARLCAAVFISAGIKVYLFSDIVATPFVPFGVLKYKCAAGIMVTASHNPKEDNGYKVYYANGAQIISPHDSGIADMISKNLQPLPSSWDQLLYSTSPLCVDPLNDVSNDYMTTIQKHCHHRELNASSVLNITYTAMHGVGAKYIEKAFESFSLKPFFTTVKQADPDPEFPTVKYPNPEEGKGALKLAIETAESNNSPFIIANDPDADRLAIAEKQEDGCWKIFTGNEIGFLLGWWAYTNHHKSNPTLYPGDSVYMVYSTVSSKALQSIGKIEGFKVEETLTGFKWMANKSIDLIEEGKHVLLAFEEAIGFMFGDQVLDKDGVSAGAIMAEFASYLYHNGSTMNKKLQGLYERYGMHVSNNSYFICHSQEVINKIFDRMRIMENGKYPSKIGSFNVLSVRDLYGKGFDSSQPNNVPVLPTSNSQMITFKFDHGCVATIRTSGTEPKIKYYSEIATDPSEKMSKEDAKNKIDDLIHHLVETLLQPEKNNLQRKVE